MDKPLGSEEGSLTVTSSSHFYHASLPGAGSRRTGIKHTQASSPSPLAIRGNRLLLNRGNWEPDAFVFQFTALLPQFWRPPLQGSPWIQKGERPVSRLRAACITSCALVVWRCPQQSCLFVLINMFRASSMDQPWTERPQCIQQ